MKRYFGKIRRDTKALSPIFAVLILIAISVIAGIIVYMFTSGYLATMMGGGSAGQEKVAIQAVVVSGSTVTLHCKSTGGGAVEITDAILKSSSGDTVEVISLGTSVLLPADGTLTDVACPFAAASVVSGNSYTVALVSAAGNQFVSPAFKAP